MSSWSGSKVRRLVNACLELHGTTCWLCGLPGADSADHEPPRSQLVLAGVPDPDHLRFLRPSHRRPCNLARGTRPVTPELRAELRAKRERFVLRIEASALRSPRFVRAFFDEQAPAAGPLLPVYPPETQEKTAIEREAR